MQGCCLTVVAQWSRSGAPKKNALVAPNFFAVAPNTLHVGLQASWLFGLWAALNVSYATAFHIHVYLKLEKCPQDKCRIF